MFSLIVREEICKNYFMDLLFIILNHTLKNGEKGRQILRNPNAREKEESKILKVILTLLMDSP